LYERGHAAELLTAEGSSLGHRASNAGICVHRVSRGFLRLPAAAKIFSLLSDGRIELVHANEAHAVTAAWIAGTPWRVPFVISRRVGYPLGKSSISRARYNSASGILANSQWVAEQAIASGANEGLLRVVHEGVVIPKQVSPEQRLIARARWGVNDDEPLLGCVGVLLPDKGQEFLIRALADVRRVFPNTRLLLAGDGSSRPILEKLAAELNLSTAVLFPGFVKDVESVYAALDIFLLPSLFEAFNNSLLAAMAYEIPSIAFSGGALAEIIEQQKSGLLISDPDVDEISSAIKRLLGDPQFAHNIARAGRARVANYFTADHMVQATLKAYEDILAGG
jgi:L-malate glycosyltransferase